MKEGWEYKRIGDICEVLDSQRKPITKSDRKPGTIPYYGATGIQDYVEGYIFDGRYLLVGEDGAKWGKDDATAYIIQGKSWVNNHAHILKFHDNVKDSFVRYYLNGKDLNGYITGAIVPKLTQAALVSIPIPIPKIAEQERIVAELDLLTGIIDKQTAQLKELDTLAQSIFYEMFGSVDYNRKNFVVKSLSEVFQLITDGTHQTPQYTDDTTNGFKFLSAKDVVSGAIDWTKIKYIPESLHNELYRRLAPRRGDILLCKNGTTGICALVETDDVFDIYVSLALLRTEDDYNRKYLVYAINNPSTKSQFDDSLKGVGVPNLHLGEIKKTKILVPPLELQQSFARKIESIESQKAAINRSIAETRKLLDYTMDKYFG